MQTVQYFPIQSNKEQHQLILFAPESAAEKDWKIWTELSELALCYEIWKKQATDGTGELARAYQRLSNLLATDNRQESTIPNASKTLSLHPEYISRLTTLKKELAIEKWQPSSYEPPEDCHIFKWVAFCEMLLMWDEHQKNTEDDAGRQAVIDAFYRFWIAQIKCANSPHGIYND